MQARTAFVSGRIHRKKGRKGRFGGGVVWSGRASLLAGVAAVALAAGGCKDGGKTKPAAAPSKAPAGKSYDQMPNDELLKLAIDSHDQNRVDDGIAQFEALLKKDENNPAGVVYYGSTLTKKAQFADGNVEKVKWVKKGFQKLDEAVIRFPNDHIVYLVRGINSVSVPVMFERYRLAVKDFEKLEEMKKADAKSVPDDVAALILFHHALAHEQSEDEAAAKALRARLMAEHPNSEWAKKVK